MSRWTMLFTVSIGALLLGAAPVRAQRWSPRGMTAASAAPPRGVVPSDSSAPRRTHMARDAAVGALAGGAIGLVVAQSRPRSFGQSEGSYETVLASAGGALAGAFVGLVVGILDR